MRACLWPAEAGQFSYTLQLLVHLDSLITFAVGAKSVLGVQERRSSMVAILFLYIFYYKNTLLAYRYIFECANIQPRLGASACQLRHSQFTELNNKGIYFLVTRDA